MVLVVLGAVRSAAPQADASMKGAKWDRTSYVGTSMVGKTLAVYGFGKVSADTFDISHFVLHSRWCGHEEEGSAGVVGGEGQTGIAGKGHRGRGG